MADTSDEANEDSVFETLKKNDPVGSAPEPDIEKIREKVFSRISLTSPSGSEKTRTWKVPMRLAPVAVAACTALAVGIGFGVVGNGTGNSSSAAPIAAGGPSVPGSGGSNEGIEPGKGSSPQDAAYWGRHERVVYKARWANGQPSFPSRIEAFTYVPLTNVEAKESLVSLAKVLSLKGTPERSGDSWTLTPPDSNASLTVGGDALGSFYLNDFSVWGPCQNEDIAPMPAPREGTGGDMLPAPDCQGTEITATKEGSLKTAKGMVVALGFSVEDFEWSADVWEGSPVQVVASKKDSGMQIDGNLWSFTFYNDDVPAYANGYLAPLATLGEYPLVSVNTAVRRLNSPRFGPLYGGGMVYTAEGDVSSTSSEPSTGAAGGKSSDGAWRGPEIPTPPKAGEPFLWPVGEALLVDASLELVMHWQMDGSVVLLPVYSMSVEGGGKVQVVAVADKSLNMAVE